MLAARASHNSMALLVRPSLALEATAATALQTQPRDQAASSLAASAWLQTVVDSLHFCTISSPQQLASTARAASLRHTAGAPAPAPAWQAVSTPCSASQLTSCQLMPAVRRSFASDKISELEAGEVKESTPAEQPAAKPTVEQLHPAQLLKRMSVMRFKEQLAAEADSTPTISYQDLLRRCQSSGAASSEQDAVQICTALTDAGVVLRFADLIYLRPVEIAEYIVQALPGSQQEVLERVHALRDELAPMEARKREIDSRAHRWVRVLLWAGLLAFLSQWTLFLRLTFWELSWDVMEPVSYFVSSAGGIFAYCYFLATHEDFGYAPWRDRIASNLQVGGYAKKGLDLRRLQLLQRDVARLERFLKR